MTTTEKMVTLEFYLLGDDYTWDTDFIEVPNSLWAKYVDNNNPSPVVDWFMQMLSLRTAFVWLAFTTIIL